jgi:hypothetical protein
MTVKNASPTLTHVGELQDALDRARSEMDQVQVGLSEVEFVAGKAGSVRKRIMRTAAIVITSVAAGALLGIKSVSDS